MSTVFDSTALAVWLTGAPGARTVGDILTKEEGVVSALSVFELAKALPDDRLADLEQLATIAPFDGDDAIAAARLALPHLYTPVLALCALAARLGAVVVTADPSLSEVDIPGVTVQVLADS